MKHTTHTAPTVKSDGRIFKHDLILILSLVLCAALAGTAILLWRGAGDTVTVTVDGSLYGTYPLDTDAEVKIRTGVSGQEHNLLIIRGGRAYMASATCPDGICVAHRPIHRHGECIVCLPHRVTVTVRTAGGEVTPDIIT